MKGRWGSCTLINLWLKDVVRPSAKWNGCRDSCVCAVRIKLFSADFQEGLTRVDR